MERVLRLGTRGSALARRQTAEVIARLRTMGIPVEVVVIRTHGDRFQHQPLYGMGVKGIFVKEIEEALRAGVIDAAVHSAKDVPTELPDGFTIAAYLPRDTPWDVWVGPMPLAEIPPGSRVGTSSLRRMAMIRHRRPDLTLVPIRGNVDTRLRKMDAGQVEALVMAAAGLERMGWRGRILELLQPPEYIPAAAQGAIAVEVWHTSAWHTWLTRLDDPMTRLAVETERQVVRRLGGGCHAPIGVYAEARSAPDQPHRVELQVQARLWTPDGGTSVYASATGSDVEEVVTCLVDRLQSHPDFSRWREDMR